MSYLFRLSLCLGLLLCQTSLWGQLINSKADFQAALKASQELKENGLIIFRLESNHLKMAHYQKLLANKNLKAKKRKKVERLLNQMQTETKAINQTILQALNDTFNFCPVYFCYDTSAQYIRQGGRSQVFLNAQGEKDPRLSIPDSLSIYWLYYEPAGGANTFNSLQLRPLKGPLRPPFPAQTIIRKSWVHNLSLPRLRRAIPDIQYRLQRLYKRAEQEAPKE
ncbi:hypothetical protein PPO43_08130 [Saprospira sp. CCB-QB6]|uniref:hypothetical protein n=1 Tax=Saprospira sp. CCB-QB6 TaxID=3023936 RepID=UPI00234B9671|nr:hypothetical protein [Saprospira sp. CCB-QB6]WCL83054.1 hypothetical protein PPO43_08130 [Saprospira sp. CCB-QB6]